LITHALPAAHGDSKTNNKHPGPRGIAMKSPAIRPSVGAGDSINVRAVSRGHLRLIQPLAPSACSNEHAHEWPMQATNCDIDPDDPPLTILAW
jgi:hypothetical protein